MKRRTPTGRLLASVVAAALLSSPAVFTASAAPAVQADRTTQALDQADLPPPSVVDNPIPEDPEVDAMTPAPPRRPVATRGPRSTPTATAASAGPKPVPTAASVRASV